MFIYRSPTHRLVRYTCCSRAAPLIHSWSVRRARHLRSCSACRSRLDCLQRVHYGKRKGKETWGGYASCTFVLLRVLMLRRSRDHHPLNEQLDGRLERRDIRCARRDQLQVQVQGLRLVPRSNGCDHAPKRVVSRRVSEEWQRGSSPWQSSSTRCVDASDKVSQFSISKRMLSRFSVSLTILTCCG